MQTYHQHRNDNTERMRKGIPDYIIVPLTAEFPSRQMEDHSLSSVESSLSRSFIMQQQHSHNDAPDGGKPPKLPRRSGHLEDQALISCRDDKIVHPRSRSLPTLLTASTWTTRTRMGRRETLSFCSVGSENGMLSVSSTAVMVYTNSKSSSESRTDDADHMDRAPRVPRRRRSLRTSSTSSSSSSSIGPMMMMKLFHSQNAAPARGSSPVAALAAWATNRNECCTAERHTEEIKFLDTW